VWVFGVECSLNPVNLLEINVPRKKGNFQKPRQRCLAKFQVRDKTCCVPCALFLDMTPIVKVKSSAKESKIFSQQKRKRVAKTGKHQNRQAAKLL